MSDSKKKQILGGHLWIVYALAIIMVAIIWYFEWIAGLILAFLLVVSFYYTFQKERYSFRKTEKYIATLSHKIGRASCRDVVCMTDVSMYVVSDSIIAQL